MGEKVGSGGTVGELAQEARAQFMGERKKGEDGAVEAKAVRAKSEEDERLAALKGGRRQSKKVEGNGEA